MATITRKGTVSPVSGNLAVIGGPTLMTLRAPMNTYFASGTLAGEPIQAGAPCFIASSTSLLAADGTTATVVGRVYMSMAVAGKNLVHGYAELQVFAPGEAVTLRINVAWDYIAASYTGIPGAPVYLGATAGTLSDAITASFGITVIGIIQPKNNDYTLAPTGLLLKQFMG